MPRTWRPRFWGRREIVLSGRPQYLDRTVSGPADWDSLIDGLQTAFPRAQIDVDWNRAVGTVNSWRGDWPWDEDEVLRREEEERKKEQEQRKNPGRPPTRVASPDIPDIFLTIVLPAATSATVTAVIQMLVEWLRGLKRDPAAEHEILIYGPRGKPIRKIRRRPGSPEPEVFERNWPLPPNSD